MNRSALLGNCNRYIIHQVGIACTSVLHRVHKFYRVLQQFISRQLCIFFPPHPFPLFNKSWITGSGAYLPLSLACSRLGGVLTPPQLSITPGWGMHLNHWLIRYLAGCVAATLISLGSFSKPRGRRRRECHQTKGLMSRTMTMYVRFESLYISLPSSAKQQREMTKFCVFRRTRTAMANLCYLLQELNAVGAFLAWANFQTDRRTEQIYRVATFEGKI